MVDVGAGRRVAADRGVPSLGLLLQLGGSLSAAYSALAVLLLLLDGVHGPELLLPLVWLVGVARGLVHRAAGTRMLYATRGLDAIPDERRFQGVRWYAVVAGVHTALALATAALVPVLSLGGAIALAGALLVWPAVLLVVVSRPALRPLAVRLPLGEDKGFEAVAIVMTVFGAAGLALATALLGSLPFAHMHEGYGLLSVLTLLALVARSALHLRAGITGLRETSTERAVHHATAYGTFGAVSTACLAGIAVLAVAANGDLFAGVLLMIATFGPLLVWPLAVRRFFRDRQFDELLAGDGAQHRRAPDAGLAGLGWLLAAFSALSLIALLVRAALPARSAADGAVSMLVPFAAPGGALVWQLAAIALGAYAAAQLVGMTSRATAATLAWAAISLGGALWQVYCSPPYEDLARVLLDGWLGARVVLGGAAIALVTRRVAPVARARYRATPGGSAP